MEEEEEGNWEGRFVLIHADYFFFIAIVSRVWIGITCFSIL